MGQDMARNTRRSNGLKKLEPAVQTFYFTTTSTTSQEPLKTDYIDLSQCASILNRRFYRQGINWMVAGIKVISSTQSTVVIRKLPSTWVLHNAWKKGMNAWRHMIDDAVDEAGAEGVKGRFLDFKIFADAKHHDQGVASNLLPLTFDDSLTSVPSVPGQWQMSSIEVPETTTAVGATTEYEIIGVGPSNPGAGASGFNAKSLIAGYATSRALPSQKDPNVPDDASNYMQNWMLALTNDGTLQNSAVVDTLEGEGNNPPYPFEGDVAGNADTMYPGGETQLPFMQVHDVASITGTTVGGITRMKGGNFPCGIIRIDHATTGTTGNIAVQVELVPGPHRGYLCESMMDV